MGGRVDLIRVQSLQMQSLFRLRRSRTEIHVRTQAPDGLTRGKIIVNLSVSVSL